MSRRYAASKFLITRSLGNNSSQSKDPGIDGARLRTNQPPHYTPSLRTFRRREPKKEKKLSPPESGSDVAEKPQTQAEQRSESSTTTAFLDLPNVQTLVLRTSASIWFSRKGGDRTDPALVYPIVQGFRNRIPKCSR